VVHAAFQVTHTQRSHERKSYLIIGTRNEMKIKWGASEWKWKRKFSIVSKRESPNNITSCSIWSKRLCGEVCKTQKIICQHIKGRTSAW